MSVLNKKLCLEFLRVKLGDKAAFEITDFQVRIPEVNHGYCSSQAHLTITAHVIVNGQPNLMTFFLFIKLATEDQVMNELFWKQHRFFEKEHAMLTRVLPELLGDTLTRLTAQCYFATEDYLVMKDLNSEGFEYPRITRFDLNHASIAFKLYAEFHAACIAAQHNSSVSLYEKYEDCLFECIYDEEYANTDERLFSSTLKRNRYFVERYYQNRSAVQREKVLTKSRARMIEFKHRSKKHLNVSSHGDAQIRNLLYKYANDAPVDVRLIDFQVSRYVPPVADLVHLLHTSTDAPFRATHETDLINLYHEALGHHLKRDYGLDVESILSRENFLESYEEYKEYGCLIDYFYTFLKFPRESFAQLGTSPDAWINHSLRGDTNFTKHVCDNYDSFVVTFKQVVDKLFELYA